MKIYQEHLRVQSQITPGVDKDKCGKKFTKKKENFICEVCGTKVFGTGFTDHCPSCLFSKHVDIYPGDREADCGGLMEPKGITKKKGRWQIYYLCQKCGYSWFNQVAENDNQTKIAELSKVPIFEKCC